MTSTQTPITTTLSSGIVVLAKLYKGQPCAMTFANRTQANNAAEKSGGWVCQIGRPFFVRMGNP